MTHTRTADCLVCPNLKPSRAFRLCGGGTFPLRRPGVGHAGASIMAPLTTGRWGTAAWRLTNRRLGLIHRRRLFLKYSEERMITNIETKITAYEINSEEVGGLSEKETAIVVSAHWSNNEMVILKFQGKEVTVAADELEKAIDNVTNH